ncbi:MAG TPA: glycosyltransferase, partial [Chloroflexia bacterium]|nr:glycosyltransferase [Chloroflexia bacterium]
MSGFDRAKSDVPGGISIVVPAYNAEATVRACIQALLRQQLAEPYEIIVVDDGSTDSTALIALEYAPRVRVISQPHRGAAAARNTGMRAASSRVILFTDADCEPVPAWARHLSKAIRDGAAGAKGTYRTRQRSITARFVQAEYESKYRRMARRTRIDFIDTYSAAYRRDVLLSVGGFDESISAVEDQELSFRLAREGHDLSFVPQAVVYHTHEATRAAYLRKKFSIGYWKVRVAALHPERIISDSHTPPSIKVQMALLAAGIPAFLLSPFSP